MLKAGFVTFGGLRVGARFTGVEENLIEEYMKVDASIYLIPNTFAVSLLTGKLVEFPLDLVVKRV